MIGRIFRAIISIVVGIIPLLYLGGYLSFFGIPSPYPSAVGSGTNSTSSFLGFQFPLAAGTSGKSLVPIAGFGITGLIIFTVLTRIGSMGAAEMSRPKMPDLSQMPSFAGMQQSTMPENLPADITKSQFVILRQYKMGLKNSKGISKRLAMDRKETEKEIG